MNRDILVFYLLACFVLFCFVLFCLCAHLACVASAKESFDEKLAKHSWAKFTFTSGTVYNRSYFEGYFVVTGGTVGKTT